MGILDSPATPPPNPPPPPLSPPALPTQAEAQLLGSSRGKQVRLLVHHSRNSEQKQWDETVVIALGGMGRLLKAHLPAVARLEGFPAGGWVPCQHG